MTDDRPALCTFCGKKLLIKQEQAIDGYDPATGRPVNPRSVDVFRCRSYSPTYSMGITAGGDQGPLHDQFARPHVPKDVSNREAILGFVGLVMLIIIVIASNSRS
jgi:hypothetical protein